MSLVGLSHVSQDCRLISASVAGFKNLGIRLNMQKWTATARRVRLTGGSLYVYEIDTDGRMFKRSNTNEDY